MNNPDGTQTTTTLDGLDASCGQINSAVQIGATQGGSINSAGQSVAIGVSSNGLGGLSVWIDGGCVSYQDGFGNSDASCVPGAYVTLLDLAASAAANNDVPVGMDLWHCQGCAATWRNANGTATAATVVVTATVAIVLVITEAAGAVAACDPGLNTSNYGHVTVYCRAWMAGQLLGIGYDPQNGLHVNVGNSIHIPLWPWP